MKYSNMKIRNKRVLSAKTVSRDGIRTTTAVLEDGTIHVERRHKRRN